MTTHTNLTRWIEDADARHVLENAMVDRNIAIGESHYLHLGETIAKVSSRVRHSTSREALRSIGSHALTRFSIR
jgi:hypothetical protein